MNPNLPNRMGDEERNNLSEPPPSKLAGRLRVYALPLATHWCLFRSKLLLFEINYHLQGGKKKSRLINSCSVLYDE